MDSRVDRVSNRCESSLHVCDFFRREKKPVDGNRDGCNPFQYFSMTGAHLIASDLDPPKKNIQWISVGEKKKRIICLFGSEYQKWKRDIAAGVETE